ncbi:MAG: hypothetical protein SH819_15135 [Cytophagales bacterium]|nr:hypothetical protein [Cytophagales bacterium]
MKTFTWKHTGWSAKHYIFSMGEQIIGQLTFLNSWNSNALYTDNETEFKFAQKSFWDRDVLITKDEKTIGEIHSGLFGEKKLTLATGETYFLSTSFWEQEVYWKTEKGETIIRYKQAAMSSLAKGSISLTDTLPRQTEKLLISGGIFIRKMTRKRIALTVAVGIPILAAASR